MTALVQPDGRVTDLLPAFERGVLRVEVQGYQGLTPYARWGDRLALAVAVLLVLALVAMRARRAEDR